MTTHPDETIVTVIEGAADILETPIDELPPLSDAIDLDALEAITSPTTSGQRSNVTVTFTYAGLHILVDSRDTVFIYPIDEETDDFIARERFDWR